jgi:type II secretory pathway predicted ATPase ExeA/DNA-binding XRE family transcriptional regulator
VSVVKGPAPQQDATRKGVRIQLGVIAAELNVSAQSMADKVGVSRRTMNRILSDNEWPQSWDVVAMKAALRELLAEHGAAPEELQTLFHQHTRTQNSARRQGTPYTQTDGYGRAPAGPRAVDIDEQSTPEDVKMLMTKQTLAPQARQQWKLFGNPFGGEVREDAQMFVNGEVAYVREACYQAAVSNSFVALVGESGAGKTTVLESLEARIEREREPVIVIRPSVVGMTENDSKGTPLKAQDILHAIVSTLDPRATVAQTLQARSRQATTLLGASLEAGCKHMLLIEEAHALPDATLGHLKRVHEMKLGRKSLLGILLVAQPELAQRLNARRANLREVAQRCELVNLLPLDNDLKAYLQHRCKVAGRDLAEFMDQSGIDEIRARLTVTQPGSGGKTRATSLLYPLAVNNLATAALNTAAELGAPLVNRDVVRAV